MAQSLRRPVSQCIGLSSSSLTRRQFSQIPSRWSPSPLPQRVARPASRPERSMKVMEREAMAKGQMNSDFGLLPETLVPPKIKLSTIFQNPLQYSRYRYQKTKNKLQALFTLVVFKLSSPRAGKRWWNRSFKIDRKRIQPNAIALHTEMYCAFAEGNVSTLKMKCTEGIFESFRTRIGQRKKGEIWKWELLKYHGTPKVVSDRTAMLPIPGEHGFGLRQAVVRIKSQQRLTRMIDGQVLEGSGESKEVLEYLVVQQFTQRWNRTNWKVWGTTKETSMETVVDWGKKKT